MLHLGDQPGQRGLGGGGGDDQQVLLAQVVQHLEDADMPVVTLSRPPRMTTTKTSAGGVEDGDEQPQRADGGPAGVADDAGDGAERADRGQPHDAGQDLEDQALQHGDEVQDRLALAAQGLHGEADEQRDEQGLQHRAGGQRGEQRGRDDVDEEVPGGLDLGDGVGGRWRGGLQAVAGVDQVAHQQARGPARRWTSR